MVEEKEQYWADLLRGTLTMPNVKQHSGSIEVDTKRGEFTEIRIVLPRATMGQ